MVPTTREIVWQLRAIAELHPKDSVSELAGKLALSPIFIINALEEGESLEWFQRKRDKKGNVTEELEILVPTDWSAAHADEVFGVGHTRVREELRTAIANSNHNEQDLEFGAIMAWCRGINPSAVEISLALLTKIGVISTYDMADPADKKSVYTFYTLTENLDHKWGSKQFTPKKKKGKK